MNRIFDLLTELSIDPFEQDAFARDPWGFMTRAGLTSEEQEILTRGDRDELGAAIASGHWARCPALVDPGPDPLPGPGNPGGRS